MMMHSGRSSAGLSQTDLAAIARRHPTAFAQLVSPPYEPGDVHWQLGDRLVGLERGEIDRLLVLAPPRHGKSELSALYFPAWFLGRNPDARVIGASYNDRLASHNGRQVRDIVASPQFGAVFPGLTVAADASAVDSWNIAGRRGGYHAAGVGGPITGFGADLFVIDDPIKNMEEADSALQRDKLEDWFESVALSRLEPGGRMVVLMTRWNRDDIAGRIIKAAGEGRDRWEVLELPALSSNGEALWPERFNADELERRRRAISPRVWASTYQQQPTTARDKIFDHDWLTRFPDSPDPSRTCIRRYIAVDTAYKEGEHNDFSVAVVAELMPDYRLFVRDVWRKRVPFTELITELSAFAAKWDRDGGLSGILIEEAASGISAYQTLAVTLPPPLAQLLIPWAAKMSKAERARLVSPLVRAGAVQLPNPSDDVRWVLDFEQELLDFPGTLHDDQVDAFVHLLHYLELVLADGIHFRAEAALQAL